VAASREAALASGSKKSSMSKETARGAKQREGREQPTQPSPTVALRSGRGVGREDLLLGDLRAIACILHARIVVLGSYDWLH
jgi:hypothetical protein